MERVMPFEIERTVEAMVTHHRANPGVPIFVLFPAERVAMLVTALRDRHPFLAYEVAPLDACQERRASAIWRRLVELWEFLLGWDGSGPAPAIVVDDRHAGDLAIYRSFVATRFPAHARAIACVVLTRDDLATWSTMRAPDEARAYLQARIH